MIIVYTYLRSTFALRMDSLIEMSRVHKAYLLHEAPKYSGRIIGPREKSIGRDSRWQDELLKWLHKIIKMYLVTDLLLLKISYLLCYELSLNFRNSSVHQSHRVSLLCSSGLAYRKYSARFVISGVSGPSRFLFRHWPWLELEPSLNAYNHHIELERSDLSAIS